jgi:hypothetical protein
MIKRVIIGLAIILVLGYLVFEGTHKSTPEKKVFDRSIRYKTNSYKPYDIKFVFDEFSKISKKGFVINDEKPDYVNKLFKSENNVFVVCGPYFLPNNQETTKLLDFVNRGNDMYLSAFTLAPVFLDTLLNLKEKAVFYNQWPPIPNAVDSTTIVWKGADSMLKSFSYPGLGVSFYNEGYLEESDNVEVLSYDPKGGYGLVSIPFGKGRVFIQTRPITMTNYFLMHKHNNEYLGLILDNIGAKNKRIIWDEFYRRHPLSRHDHDVSKPGDSYFMELVNQNPPLQWAVYTFLFGLGLFVLIYSRRIQRPVPVITEVKNTSYDFTKALAGLYWLKQDNKNVSEKIAYHFFDYLQNKYRINPKDFDLKSAPKIAGKTGKNESEVQEIIRQLEFLKQNERIDKKWLIKFYKDIHKFSKS